MIKLSAAAQAKFGNLKVPPTHAALCSRLLQQGLGATHDVVGFTLNYWYGTLDAAGLFVLDATLPTVVVQVPNPAMVAAIGMPKITAMLTALFGAGVVPNPSDPTLTLPMPSKKAGDHKTLDIDVAAAYLEPALAGTVV